jgi:hypothetical protein
MELLVELRVLATYRCTHPRFPYPINLFCPPSILERNPQAESSPSGCFFQTGLAASVDLRCFGLLEPNKSSSGSITLSIPDLSSTQTWASETLPWDLAPQWTEPPTELDQALLSRCEELAEVEGIDDRGRVSAAAFLYLLVILSKGVPSYVVSPFPLFRRPTLQRRGESTHSLFLRSPRRPGPGSPSSPAQPSPWAPV